MSEKDNPPPDPEGTLEFQARDDQLLASAIAEFLDLQTSEEGIPLEEFLAKQPLAIRDRLRSELLPLVEFEAILEPTEIPAAKVLEKAALPERLSGYRILRELGSGGMGRVLLAQDERLGRQVAIKMLAPELCRDQELRERFLQEARAMARLSHPNVVRIYSLGPENEPPHFVMELVEGIPATDAARPLSMRQKAELLHSVAKAVDFLHQHRILHRDLKPGNILVGLNQEPKVLDFGLAFEVDESTRRLTRAGVILGTPDYLSPEQTRGDSDLDARSDVFALGILFYEMLTGTLPFADTDLSEQLRKIREADPILPRRLNADVPGELQNICLKALEKEAGQRYSSARDLAADLERYLSGEPILASPTSYTRLISGKIDAHLHELRGWLQDRILSDFEYDRFRRLYERLIEREDAWIMEVRRLSFPQVTLYLGGWVLVVGTALLALFHYSALVGTPKVLLAAAACIPPAWIGLRCWKGNQLRVAVAFLLSFCLLLPVTLLIAMGEWRLLSTWTQNREDLEFFTRFPSMRPITNTQIWWALLLSLPAYGWLRRFTRSSVFTLVLSFMLAWLCVVTLLRMGMLEWLEKDPGRVYLRLIPFAIMFMALGFLLERLQCAADSRHFYPFAVLFTYLSLSGVALFHEPYAMWLKESLPATRGQLEYLFILNGAIYFLLQAFCDRFRSTQMRWVGKSFRFVIPGHVMTSLFLLGWAATGRWEDYRELRHSAEVAIQKSQGDANALALPRGNLGNEPARAHLEGSTLVIVDADNRRISEEELRREARFFELALPLVACLFILGSIPKQMKNFLATGLLFLAIGLVRLQQNLFKDVAVWPIALLAIGLLLMFFTVHYPPFRMNLSRLFRRPRR